MRVTERLRRVVPGLCAAALLVGWWLGSGRRR